MLEYICLANLLVAQQDLGKRIKIAGHRLASVEFLGPMQYQAYNTDLCTWLYKQKPSHQINRSLLVSGRG